MSLSLGVMVRPRAFRTVLINMVAAVGTGCSTSLTRTSRAELPARLAKVAVVAWLLAMTPVVVAAQQLASHQALCLVFHVNLGSESEAFAVEQAAETARVAALDALRAKSRNVEDRGDGDNARVELAMARGVCEPGSLVAEINARFELAKNRYAIRLSSGRSHVQIVRHDVRVFARRRDRIDPCPTEPGDCLNDPRPLRAFNDDIAEITRRFIRTLRVN